MPPISIKITQVERKYCRLIISDYMQFLTATLTWKPSVSSIPFTCDMGTGEFEREPGVELDLEEAWELLCEIWEWAMREADVGREAGRELGAESALVTLDSGAKIPDNRSKKKACCN